MSEELERIVETAKTFGDDKQFVNSDIFMELARKSGAKITARDRPIVHCIGFTHELLHDEIIYVTRTAERLDSYIH